MTLKLTLDAVGALYSDEGQAEDLPSAGQAQNSPYDSEARYGKKRETTCVGDKAHLTETCDADTPHLLIQVTTTSAATADETTLTAIQDALALCALLPSTQVVNAEGINAEALAHSRTQFGIDQVGPTRGDYRRQAHRQNNQTGQTSEPDPFDRSRFVIDWAAWQVTCSEGRTSTQSAPALKLRLQTHRAMITDDHCGLCDCQLPCSSQRARCTMQE